jgi:beta-mannosidase
MIDNKKGDLKLSDNFFDMQAGKRSIKILSGTLEGIYVRSVFDIR